MSETLHQVQRLVSENKVRVSDHGYDELAADDLYVDELLSGLQMAIVVEDYPDFHKGPCVLVLQQSQNGKLVHVVWGIPKDHTEPAVLVTAYRPDPAKWYPDFQRRK